MNWTTYTSVLHPTEPAKYTGSYTSRIYCEVGIASYLICLGLWLPAPDKEKLNNKQSTGPVYMQGPNPTASNKCQMWGGTNILAKNQQ